jgi:hypothetical protein
MKKEITNKDLLKILKEGFQQAKNERESLLFITKKGFDDQSEQIETNRKAIESLSHRVSKNGDWIARMSKKVDQELAAATLDRKRLHKRIDEHHPVHHS